MQIKSALKALVFALVGALLFITLHQLIYAGHHGLRTKNDPNAIYMIGDSRSVHGIDIETLGARLGRPVYSHATHGASPYAFLALAETVPPGAVVLFSPSHGMLARDREKVSYDSALSFRGLSMMLERGYDRWYFREVFEANRYPLGAPFWRINREGFAARDEVIQLRQRFAEIYEQKTPPWHYEPNQDLLIEAVRVMSAKGCDVRFVEMPVTDELAQLMRGSIYRGGLFGDVPELLKLEGPKIFRDIRLEAPEGKNIWHDLDHLNVLGRGLMTEWLLSHAFADLK